LEWKDLEVEMVELTSEAQKIIPAFKALPLPNESIEQIRERLIKLAETSPRVARAEACGLFGGHSKLSRVIKKRIYGIYDNSIRLIQFSTQCVEN